MHISKVEMIVEPEVKEGTLVDGLPIPAHPERTYFIIKTDETDVEGATVTVPADPANRHYQEIAEWYKNLKTGPLKKKPFKYDF